MPRETSGPDFPLLALCPFRAFRPLRPFRLWSRILLTIQEVENHDRADSQELRDGRTDRGRCPTSRRLAAHKFGRRSSVRIQLLDGGNEAETVAVPASAIRLFLHLLTEMSQGNAVTLIPTHAELTTQQPADLLNVSRPYVVKLLDEGKSPAGPSASIAASALMT